MTWFMIDDGIYDSPQCEELPLSAIGLWALAGSYVGRQLRHGDYDGAITMQRVRKLGGSPKLARQLVDAGLWRETEPDVFEIVAANPDGTMMTNSVANNGNPFGATDYLIHKPKILDTGVQILEYDQGVSYHGKCFTIGDRLTGVGSFNWDMRSAYIDTELMLVIDSAALNASMRNYMETYEHDALEVKDKTTYHLKEGQIPQVISDKRKTRVRLLKPLDWLIRYLL